MRFTLLFVMAAFLTVGISSSSFAQEKKDTKKETVTSTKPGKPINTICPVTDEEVDGDITVVYEGKTVALCCKSCLKKFNKNPEKYMKKLNENKSKE